MFKFSKSKMSALLHSHSVTPLHRHSDTPMHTRRLSVSRSHRQAVTPSFLHMVCTVEYDRLLHRWIRRWTEILDVQTFVTPSHHVRGYYWLLQVTTTLHVYDYYKLPAYLGCHGLPWIIRVAIYICGSPWLTVGFRRWYKCLRVTLGYRGLP